MSSPSSEPTPVASKKTEPSLSIPVGSSIKKVQFNTPESHEEPKQRRPPIRRPPIRRPPIRRPMKMYEPNCTPLNVYGFYIPQEVVYLFGKYHAGYGFADPVDPSFSQDFFECKGFTMSGIYCRNLFPHIPLRWERAFSIIADVDGTPTNLPALVLGFRYDGKDIIDVTNSEHIDEIKRVLRIQNQEPQWFTTYGSRIPHSLCSRIVRISPPYGEEEKPEDPSRTDSE